MLSRTTNTGLAIGVSVVVGTWLPTGAALGQVEWTRYQIDANFIEARFTATADVDDDGDVDVLGAADQGGDITWWENTNGNGSAWVEHLIDGDMAGGTWVHAVDFDVDGWDLDLDIAVVIGIGDGEEDERGSEGGDGRCEEAGDEWADPARLLRFDLVDTLDAKLTRRLHAAVR